MDSEPTDVSTAFSALVGISDYKVLYAFVALKLPGVLYLGRSFEKSSDCFRFGELFRLVVGGAFEDFFELFSDMFGFFLFTVCGLVCLLLFEIKTYKNDSSF